MSKADFGMDLTRLRTVNQGLKVASKYLLQNEDLVMFVKAVKIALDVKLNKTYDKIIPFLPQLVSMKTPIILDIGANMGQFAARLSRQFSNGQIHSFEPLHGNAVGLRRLKCWLRLENVTIHEEALCDHTGVEAMHIPIFGTYRDGALAVLEESKKPYDNVRYHVEIVRTDSIDAFAAAHGIDRVDFIKIDTEGAEERVVNGGMKLIRQSLPIMYLEAPHHDQWLSSLYDEGYCPFYTDGTTLYPPHDGEQQTNVLLVHQSKIERATGARTTTRRPSAKKSG